MSRYNIRQRARGEGRSAESFVFLGYHLPGGGHLHKFSLDTQLEYNRWHDMTLCNLCQFDEIHCKSTPHKVLSNYIIPTLGILFDIDYARSFPAQCGFQDVCSTSWRCVLHILKMCAPHLQDVCSTSSNPLLLRFLEISTASTNPKNDNCWLVWNWGCATVCFSLNAEYTLNLKQIPDDDI